MGLRTKIIMTMVSLFILTSISLFIISQNSQKKLLQEVQESIDDLTKAIQVSVEKLTSEDEIDQTKLTELIDKFKKKGINEVSILSEDKTIIASSNPKKVGKISERKKIDTDFLIKAELGERSTSENKKEFNIPIIIGDENYGYINIIMHLENFTKVQQRHFYLRVFASLLIFLVGTTVIFIMGNQYIKPIKYVVSATQKVSRGDLTPIELNKNVSPELRDLIVNFNDMVHKLKDRQELEKKIEEMEHMFQIGQLSSAIAHEIKNPLNFMSLAVSQIKDELTEINHSDTNEFIPTLSALEEEIHKINSLVVNFLEYGRPLKLFMSYFNLLDIFNKLSELIESKTTDLNIDIVLDIPEELHLIADKDKIVGCFLNLFMNSIDSIKQNGVISVNAKREDKNIFIKFKDTGQGIDISLKDKIFDPYFSSKKTGTGLGLAFTKKIITEHSGEIYLNESVDNGAEFIIKIPVNI